MPQSNPFPNLNFNAVKKTSEKDTRYNCIAWSFHNNRRWWWPDNPMAYWPPDCRGVTCLDSFTKYFESEDWEKVNDRNFEENYEKVALYVDKDGVPTHAARMLENGSWTSKLGCEIDIQHELSELEDGEYGTVAAIYKKIKKDNG